MRRQSGGQNSNRLAYNVELTLDDGDDSSKSVQIAPRHKSALCEKDVGSHRKSHAVTTTLTNSYYRPCLPAEKLPSTCAPLNVWRPSRAPASTTFGRPNRSELENGSGWPAPQGDHFPCASDRSWVRQCYVPPVQHAAGTPTFYNGALSIRPREKPIPRFPPGKNAGDKVPRLRPRGGDVFILPCIDPGVADTDRRGYVGFVKNSGPMEFEPGTMIVRIAKSKFSQFRMRKRVKLFLLTTDGQWRFKGELDTDGFLDWRCDPSNYQNVPVRYRRALRVNTSDVHCIPQRGDIIISEPWKDLPHFRSDVRSCLKWFLPAVEIDMNDVLVRMAVWKSAADSTMYEGFVDLYCFCGRGLGWVFLGRDEAHFAHLGLQADSDTSDDEE